MKKTIATMCLMSLLIVNLPVIAITTQESNTFSKIQPDWFEDIIPTDLNYQYIDPIKRPKWVYPLAWVGYVGTIFIIV